MSKDKAERLLQHAFDLNRLFPNGSQAPQSVLGLAKRLHRLEAEAHRLAERECNEQLPDGYAERKSASILRRVRSALGETTIPIILNGDPRGYALKIPDDYMRANNIDLHRDMGGYGILAPE